MGTGACSGVSGSVGGSTSSGVIQRHFPTLAAAEAFVFGCGTGSSPALEEVRSRFGVSGLELSPRELATANVTPLVSVRCDDVEEALLERFS